MPPRRRTVPWSFSILALSACLLVSSCGPRARHSDPEITFSKVPPASLEGPEALDTIEGHATDVRPGQSVVLYVKGVDLWWVQPFADRPLTKIQADSSWKGQTHLGREYAALLVDSGYTPSDTIKALPSPGAGVAAVARVAGSGAALAPPQPSKTLQFSGYDWTVRREASFRGGTGNTFDPDNAWIDGKGALHLRIAANQNHSSKSQSKWTCAEVELNRSLGYGTYVFTVRDTAHLEPAAVLSLFTWDDKGTEQNRREMDVEISRWGDPKGHDTQYVVQPYYVPSNIYRLKVQPGIVTHSLRWEPGQATFSTTMGTDESANKHPVDQHIFRIGVPPADDGNVHMSLYVFGAGKTPLNHETEVVIEKFEFLP
jgi:hypothetical protein